MEKRDLIVVGGGPAGAAAARAARDAGLAPLLLEASKLPKRKACGGLLPASALALAEQRFGPTPRAALRALVPLVRVHLRPGEAYEAAPHWPAVRVERGPFDTSLLARCGAEIRAETPVEGIDSGTDGVIVDLGPETEPLQAECVVVAAGAGSPLTPVRFVRRWLAFAGHLRYEAGRPTGNRELLLLGDPDHGLATFDPDGGCRVSLTVVTKDPRRWKAARMRALAFARAVGMEPKAEQAAEFGWLSRGGPWLGRGRVLVAGDAGGMGLALGLGLEAALRSGLAAGAAAARFVTGTATDPQTEYAERLAPFLQERAAERRIDRLLLGRLGGFCAHTDLGTAWKAAPLLRRPVFGLRLSRVIQELDAPAPPPRKFPV